MERLLDEILTAIIEKVVAFGTQDLFRFRATYVRQRRLANKKVVFRALSKDCLWYIADH